MKKKSNRIEKKSALITLILQIVLLCGFYFVIAWKEPNPPIPQYGIELGFGTFTDNDEAKSNQINELPTENDQIIKEETDNDDLTPDEAIDSQENLESIDETQNEIIDQKIGTNQTISSSESTVREEDETIAIPEESEQTVKAVERVTQIEEDTKSKDSTTEKLIKKEYIVSENSSLDDSESESQVKKDQTNPETVSSKQINEIDERALYKANSGSKQGVNEGPELQISGWKWGTQKPRPMDTSDEIVGKVICNIRVDSDGYISAQLDSYTTPPSVAISYKNSLDGLQLEVKDQGVTLGSIGKVIFILKPKID